MTNESNSGFQIEDDLSGQLWTPLQRVSMWKIAAGRYPGNSRLLGHGWTVFIYYHYRRGDSAGGGYSEVHASRRAELALAWIVESCVYRHIRADMLPARTQYDAPPLF
jgi:hypothetical protein